jgi:hypothetical protein
MIAAGFPIRGGMALGPYSESEVLIFSQAQVEAYDLESVHALYPRIILSSPLLGRVDEMEDDEIRRTAKELIIVDGDDIAFINYLIFEEEDSWFGGHRFYHEQKQALDGALLNRAFDFSTVSKYKWMARFHNWSLRQTAHILKKSGTLSEDDVWSFSSLIVKHPVGDGDFKSLLWADPTFERAIQQEGDLGVDWIKQWPGVMTDDDEDEGEGEDEGLI